MTSENRVLTPSDSAYRLPSQPQVLEVTADMASDWLTSRNHPNNRPLSRVVSARYQRDMEAKLWREETPEGYIFDTEGYILSGQHRLKAQANSGVTLKMWIFPDQPRDTFGVLDSGYKRNAAHMIHNKYSTTIAAAARHLASLKDGDLWGMPRYTRVTTAEILKTASEWPELSWYGNEIFTAYSTARIPNPPHTAVLAMAARTDHIGKIKPWLEGITHGAGLELGDPRLALRNRYSSGYQSNSPVPKRELNYAQVVKAWNAYVLGREMPLLVYRINDTFPKVEGFDWSNPEGK